MADKYTVLTEEEKRKIIEATNSLNRIVEITSLQVRPVFDLLNSDYFRNYLININESLNLVSKTYTNYLASLPRIVDIITPIIQAQLQFRNDYLKIISQSLNTYSVLDQISRQWTQTLISFRADILGLKFDFQYTRKTYREKRQVVVEMDNGVNENGLEIYQSFEKDGQKYKLVAVPEQNYQKLTSAYTGVIFDTKDVKLAISTQTTTILGGNQNPNFTYDTKTATLFVGSYQRILNRGFVHRSLSIITKNKNNKKKVWYYSELLEMDDPEELNRPNSIKKCKDSFYYLKRNLPPEIKDFLIIKSDHVYINEKYIK